MQLELQQTSISYANQTRPVVESVSLSLAAGAIGVLLGPSGSGKTTLLRAVAGLEPLTHGSISLGGRTLSTASMTLAPEQRRMGMVFQDYALFPPTPLPCWSRTISLRLLPSAIWWAC